MAGLTDGWMAIYTKPRNEKKVAERFSRNGIEYYLPLIEQKRKWSDRYKTVKVPVISSYIFVRVSEQERFAVLQDPGVLNFVYWLSKPAVVTNEEIERMRFVLKEAGANYQVELEQFQAGDKVTVSDGAFAGNAADVIEVGGKEIILLLKGLGVRLRLTPLNVKKLKN